MVSELLWLLHLQIGRNQPEFGRNLAGIVWNLKNSASESSGKMIKTPKISPAFAGFNRFFAGFYRINNHCTSDFKSKFHPHFFDLQYCAAKTLKAEWKKRMLLMCVNTSIHIPNHAFSRKTINNNHLKSVFFCLKIDICDI